MTEEAAAPESFSTTYLGLAACMCIAPATQRRWEARLLIASDADVDLAEKGKIRGTGFSANSASWAMDYQFESCFCRFSLAFPCVQKMFRLRLRLALRFPRGSSQLPSLWLSSSPSLMSERPLTNTVGTCLPCSRQPHRGQ